MNDPHACTHDGPHVFADGREHGSVDEPDCGDLAMSARVREHGFAAALAMFHDEGEESK